jgi:superfamily II DNA or RNA helicase
MQLRDYQEELKQGVYRSWGSGARNVVGVMPTGAGKTCTVASIVHEHMGGVAMLAHRNELVSQLSVALGREGIMHGLIASEPTVKEVCREHARELGAVMIDPNSPVKVAGVNTITAPRRREELTAWANQVSLWVLDEVHHLQAGNIFGRAVQMFPNAKGLGVTATPCRSDGRGLSRETDGLLDDMVEGPTMRELINRGHLSDYKIFAPPSDLDVSHVETGRDGDFKKPQLKKAVQESHIVGDVVGHYIRIAHGKLGVTFATDVETATEIAAQYRTAGVPAEVLSAKTKPVVRAEIIRRFRNREIWQIVNCDILGEGFDLGGGATVEVVSMARPTQSYGLFCQQFGRGIRPKADGSPGIIIDHVGNVVRHGLPDKERIWSLDARERRPRMKNPDDEIPLRYCVECTQPYERVLVACPYCGTVHVPAARNKPEYVDGDLYELSPDVLAQMRGEIDRVDEDPASLIRRMTHAGAPDVAVRSASKQHGLRMEAQKRLRESMAWWSAQQHVQGRPDKEIQRRFYHTFGIDMMSAQALGRPDAEKLMMTIVEKM